jgi:hypothetical protein
VRPPIQAATSKLRMSSIHQCLLQQSREMQIQKGTSGRYIRIVKWRPITSIIVLFSESAVTFTNDFTMVTICTIFFKKKNSTFVHIVCFYAPYYCLNKSIYFSKQFHLLVFLIEIACDICTVRTTFRQSQFSAVDYKIKIPWPLYALVHKITISCVFRPNIWLGLEKCGDYT